jgi:hypothetical protein
MALIRLRAVWTGFNGAPGYNIFHFDTGSMGAAEGAQQAADKVSAFFTAIRANFNQIVNIRPESSAEVIDEPTGQITDIVSLTPAAAEAGAATAGFSGVSGAVVHWTTDGFKNGRRVRGKSFLVPLASTAYEGNGTLTSGAITGITTAANNLIANDFDTVLCVYSRPVNGAGGAKFDVTGTRVPDKAAILRSRRD